MAAPTSLLKGARAFARDMPREAMAPGYLWDVVDFLPSFGDAPLTGRGAWAWGSDAAASDFASGILAPFSSGEKNLGAVSSGTLYEIGLDPPYPLTNRGAIPLALQNPVMLFDQVIWMDATGSAPPSVVSPTGAPVVLAGRPHVRVGTIWGHYFVGGNAPGQEDTVFWSAPSDVTAAWDANALFRTAGAVTGLAATRSQILVFHPSNVERLRGSRPPALNDPGDMVLEPLFGQVGTTEPKSIAYWQENVLFADEHGVHMTDGTVIKNLVQQGQIQNYWRGLYDKKRWVVGCVFLDYYVVTITRTDDTFSTLICDLNQRRWYRVSNVPAIAMWASGGSRGMERFWGGLMGYPRLARLSPMFFPAPDDVLGSLKDANGTPVQPSLETPFYKLAAEGRKRVRFVYLSYDLERGLATDGGFLPTGSEYIHVDFIREPNGIWHSAGGLPETKGYARHRLPVGQFSYGIGFRFTHVGPILHTRISDIAVEAHAVERSRV